MPPIRCCLVLRTTPPLVVWLGWLLLSLLPSLHALPTRALTFNNFFSNHMVLQRTPQQAVVWGYGEPRRLVTVTVDNASGVSVIVSSDGDWRVQLPAMSASFNRTITASDGLTTLTLGDVAFGDVFLCSGQSNMEIALNYSFGGAAAIAAASDYPNIRLFNIHSSWNDTALNQSAHLSYSPDSWVLPSSTTLAVPAQVYDFFSAVCWWSGAHISDSLNGTVPIGLVHSSFGGTIVEAWTSPDTNTACGPITLPVIFPNNNPSALYNAMIHPLLPMRLTAVLWYQGESDFYDVQRYQCSFPNLISDWRTQFGLPELPFYFVLLSPYSNFDYQLPLLRRAQLFALSLGKNVGVASAIDLGDLHGSQGDLHPRNKSYIGERLSRWVRRDIYKQSVQALGPVPLSDSAAVRVTAALTGGNETVVTVVLTYPVDEANSGLYVLPSPDCTRCCQGGAGVLLVTINDTRQGSLNMSSTLYRPVVSLNPQMFTLNATITTPAALSLNATVTVGLEAEPWPQCVLYNRHHLPALPFTVTVPIGQGGGGSGEEDEDRNTWVWVAALLAVGVVVAVLVGIATRYVQKRRARNTAEASGHAEVGERTATLLGDPHDRSQSLAS